MISSVVRFIHTHAPCVRNYIIIEYYFEREKRENAIAGNGFNYRSDGRLRMKERKRKRKSGRRGREKVSSKATRYAQISTHACCVSARQCISALVFDDRGT